MAPGLELGIDQIPVDGYLVTPAIGGNQGDRLDLRLIVLEQLGRQTGGPVGIVSGCTVHHFNFHQHVTPPVNLNKFPAGDATG